MIKKILAKTYISSAISQAAGYTSTIYFLSQGSDYSNLILNTLPIVTGICSLILTSKQLAEIKNKKNNAASAVIYIAGIIISYLLLLTLYDYNYLFMAELALGTGTTLYSCYNLQKNQKYFLSSTLYSLLMISGIIAVHLENSHVLIIPTIVSSISIINSKITKKYEIHKYKEIITAGLTFAPLILYPTLEAIFIQYVYTSTDKSAAYLGISRIILGITNFIFSGLQIATLGNTNEIKIYNKYYTKIILYTISICTISSLAIYQINPSYQFIPFLIANAIIQNFTALKLKSEKAEKNIFREIFSILICTAIYATPSIYFHDTNNPYIPALAALTSSIIVYASAKRYEKQ